MAWDFDHRRAHRRLVTPLFRALPEDQRELVADVSMAAGDMKQGANCDLIWPDDNGVTRGRLEAVPAITLARIAHIIYDFGHWNFDCTHWTSELHSECDPKPWVRIPEFKTETIKPYASWKFSNLADQVLREKAGLECRGSEYDKSGWSFQIHAGLLRACHSSSNHWMWREAAMGTEDSVVLLKAYCEGKRCDDVLDDGPGEVKLRDVSPVPADMRPFLDMKGHGYYTHKEDTDICSEEAAHLFKPMVEPLFEVRGVQSINWRVLDERSRYGGHPYTIGTKHMNGDGIGGMDMSVGCEYKEPRGHVCGISHKKHVSDTVLALQLTRNCLHAEAAVVLLSLEDKMTEAKVDGFILVETEQEFRIADITPEELAVFEANKEKEEEPV